MWAPPYGTISRNTIYMERDRVNRDEMVAWLESKLSKKRFVHTLGVEETALHLGGLYGTDRKKTGIAALLHDSARWMDIDTLREYAVRAGYVPDDISRNSNALLHAAAGVTLAREQFGIDDEEILSAIRWHTTGTNPMTTLDKVIHVADMIEPNRAMFEGLATIRKKAEEDLDEALQCALASSYHYLQRQNKPVHPDTLRAMEMYPELYKEINGGM